MAYVSHTGGWLSLRVGTRQGLIPVPPLQVHGTEDLGGTWPGMGYWQVHMETVLSPLEVGLIGHKMMGFLNFYLYFLWQPYREIFEFFIEDFKTYKPLLSSIKNAYEVMLGKTAAPVWTPPGMDRLF